MLTFLESVRYPSFVRNSNTALITTHISRKHSIHLVTKSQSRRFRILSQTEWRLSVTISIPVKHRRLPWQTLRTVVY
ncbi:PIN domain containing protein (plasmid) [Halapricum desulfuricans]|uniref:PIN domain containing protein n=1 Tax=Halapricum desulfuricans TaxID=2841257 RepID=A0A897NGG7_9EURY|nr:PIN domain containing protein [Halapricum desulfuricans]